MRSGKFFQSISLVTNNLVCHQHFGDKHFVMTWSKLDKKTNKYSSDAHSDDEVEVRDLWTDIFSGVRNLLVRTALGSLMEEGNQVRQTEGEFSFHCEGRNVHVHHVTINNYVIHGSESSPRQTHDEKQNSKNKGTSQNCFQHFFLQK